MANNIMQQAQQLKLLIDQAREQSENDHDSVIEMLRAQFEKEKNEVSLLSPSLHLVAQLHLQQKSSYGFDWARWLMSDLGYKTTSVD